jgi:hypothetical protein
MLGVPGCHVVNNTIIAVLISKHFATKTAKPHIIKAPRHINPVEAMKIISDF